MYASKSVKERQIPYNFTYMWDLKNNVNDQTQQKQTRGHGDQRRWLPEGKEVRGLRGKGEGVEKYKLAVTK